MKKEIAYALTLAAVSIAAFLIENTQGKPVSDSYINTESVEFHRNYIDMRDVIDFTLTGNTLRIYTSEGNEYVWEDKWNIVDVNGN